jgi:hypothetical protein
MYHPDMDELKDFKDPGYLFYAPLTNEEVKDEWFDLGEVDDDDAMVVTYARGDDHPFINVKEWLRPVSFTMPALRLSPLMWRYLTGCKHPRVSAMRRAYRAKQGRR